MQKDSLLIVEIWHAVRTYWFVVVGAVAALGVGAGVYAYSMTPVYQASALLAPVAERDARSALGGLLSQFGGLATAAGATLGVGSTNEHEAMAILTSREFTEQFIDDSDLLPVLFADRWDSEASDWLADVPAPDLADGYRRFADVRVASLDRQTGFITLTIEWTRPEIAAEWTNGLVRRLNETMRAKAIDDAERGLEYLERELEKTSVVEIRQAIFSLTEGQIRRIMLANVQEDYAFRVLDAAVPAKEWEYVRPREVPMILAGVVLGMVVGVGLALILWARSNVGRE